MHTLIRYLLVLLLVETGYSTLCSQNVQLVYRERESSISQAPLVLMHKTNSRLFVAFSNVGVFTTTGLSNSLVPVEGVNDAYGYQANYACDCANGDYLLHQYGFLGNRIFRLDSQGAAQKVIIADGELLGVDMRGNGAVVCQLKSPTGVASRWVTLDCGRSWFQEDGFPSIALRSAVLHEHSNPFRYSLSRGGLGNRAFPTSIRAKNGLHSVSILGQDSVVWITRGRSSVVSDTIWYSDIRDSTKTSYDTILQVIGIQDRINLRDVRLIATNSGTAFMFHQSGWYASHYDGRWRLIDTLPKMLSMQFISSSSTSSADDILRYVSVGLPDQQLVTVFLDKTFKPGLVQNAEPPLLDMLAISVVSPELTSILWRSTTSPLCMYSDAEGMQVINSITKDIEGLPLTPILFGFTNLSREPIVVPYSDCSVLVRESGIGLLRATNIRGEYWVETGNHGPRIQTSQGLRTPFVGRGEVIFPGKNVRQYTRDGRLSRVVSSTPTTAVFRLEDSTLLMAQGSFITRLGANGDRDTVDLAPIVCSPSDTIGYVNSFVPTGDGSLIVLVNGLRLLDLETLGTKPWRCGGVLRSIDAGRTWVRSTAPLESPYFLGSLRTPSGVIVASVTSVIRDTTFQTSEDQAPLVESRNHTFYDRMVIRSIDNGVTWTSVYNSSSSNSFRLVGGDGVITKDGTLLLMTTDGVLQSTNDGLDWDFHDPVGMDAGAQIISLFQDTVGSPVYYCTTVGLYKEQPVTDVQDDQQRSNPRLHAARTWNDHVSFWKRSGIEVKRLFSMLGVEMPLTDPPPGLYVAECVMDSVVRVEPILVVSE